MALTAPATKSTHNRKKQLQRKKSSAYVAAPELAEDRIADYTWWLSAFTLALVVISVSQIFFLTRADKTARTAAEAAKAGLIAAARKYGEG
jgi:hypothetical protein